MNSNQDRKVRWHQLRIHQGSSLHIRPHSHWAWGSFLLLS